jgi:hypothetical protein
MRPWHCLCLGVLLAFGHSAAASDEQPVSFSAVTLNTGEDGRCRLAVDTRDPKDSHTPAAPAGKPVDLPLLGQVSVWERQDKRLHVVYDFKKLADRSKLIAPSASPDERKAFEAQVGLDADEGVLVLRPDERRRATFAYPRPVQGPVELAAHLTGMREGIFLLQLRAGHDLLVISLHAKGSPEEPAGTVVASRRTKDGPFKTLLKTTQTGGERRDYSFELAPAAVRQRGFLSLGYVGDLPLAIPRLEVTASFPPLFGVQFEQRGRKVVVARALEGGAGAKAGLKSGDLILKLNEQPAKDVAGVMQLLADGGLAKDAVFEVERYGRRQTVKIVPQ